MARGWSQSSKKFNGHKVYKSLAGMLRGMGRRRNPVEQAVLYKLPHGHGYAFLEPRESIFGLPLGSLPVGLYFEGRLQDVNSDTLRRFHGYSAA